jgi:hypothetical protein
MWHESVDLISLAQDSMYWRAVVNTVMNSRVQYKFDEFLVQLGRSFLYEVTYLHIRITIFLLFLKKFMVYV